MPNKEMRAAVEEFILQRINDWGSDESQGLQTAIEQWKLSTENLKRSLSNQQEILYREQLYPYRDGAGRLCSSLQPRRAVFLCSYRTPEKSLDFLGRGGATK